MQFKILLQQKKNNFSVVIYFFILVYTQQWLYGIKYYLLFVRELLLSQLFLPSPPQKTGNV